MKQPTAYTSTEIAIGVLERKGAFAFHIDSPGDLNFKDPTGATVNLPETMMTAGGVLYYQATEVLAGTTATGRVLYLRDDRPVWE